MEIGKQGTKPAHHSGIMRPFGEEADPAILLPLSGCSAAWLARLTGGQKVVGSNPASPTPHSEAEGPSAFRFVVSGSVCAALRAAAACGRAGFWAGCAGLKSLHSRSSTRSDWPQRLPLRRFGVGLRTMDSELLRRDLAGSVWSERKVRLGFRPVGQPDWCSIRVRPTLPFPPGFVQHAFVPPDSPPWACRGCLR